MNVRAVYVPYFAYSGLMRYLFWRCRYKLVHVVLSIKAGVVAVRIARCCGEHMSKNTMLRENDVFAGQQFTAWEVS